ncbi:deoxyuridine 5'-triphosphate nucleotidohydrolase [Candidatus Berkelbacteria bacterium RBG_13_40_8]|uniref:dUTP diphosphatase n=1 Tax=Candidatus Berkelbacteria bacterium RBG_13_40_8 TaxID=1797467 RepID=A0A1F5DMK8_9BACT|nr:MAG: deoxyuridine 5'-triphosphate nucleotidohydrolase [Candidatus Berkelbacteria bacterium RBG_13_40_8]
MLIKFKRLHKNAILPKYAHPGDAGMDLFSLETYILEPGKCHPFALGFSLEFPEGYTALVWDKGSLPFKHGLHVIGGVFDTGYRGEYIIMLINLNDKPYKIEKGDKIAQLLIQPVVKAQLEEVKELSKTSRGGGRLGSTGKK